MGRYIVGITGASGSIYAKSLIDKLIERRQEVFICITDAGKLVVDDELGLNLSSRASQKDTEEYLRSVFSENELIHYRDIRAIGADIASGSFNTDGMVILPCSMGTLSSISHGSSHNLLERAADVCLKERKRLVIVPREAPYNTIHLENMTRLSSYGATIMPASPGFYSKPKSLEELIGFFTIRVLDQLGIREENPGRWAGFDREA